MAQHRISLHAWFRYLALCSRPDELQAMHWRGYLGPALISTWVVGMGRYWDHPSAGPLQMLGVGSLVYVFVLGALLWAVMKPLRAQNWSYLNVVTFVALTSPPALLYALPVERWMSLDEAIRVNAWFLAIVASWRVAALVMLLRRAALLPRAVAGVATLLPLTVIVTALAMLNLEKAVFAVMAGFQTQATANDGAYAILALLTMLSYAAILPLLIGYVVLVVRARLEKQQPHRPV